MDLTAFNNDQKTYDAVERCLERIAEAGAKLGESAPGAVPDQPWDEIRGLGNKLRHEYNRIAHERLWSIVQEGPPSLLAGCEKALQSMSSPNPSVNLPEVDRRHGNRTRVTESPLVA